MNGKKLNELADINPNNDCKIKDIFEYLDLESVEIGRVIKYQIINKKKAPSRAQRIVKKEDILYQLVRPYQRNNFIEFRDQETMVVASTGFAVVRAKEKNYPLFLYYLINTNLFTKKVLQRCTGTSYPAINSQDLSNILEYVSIDFDEQSKIADLLSAVDDLIAQQTDKIQAYERLKKFLLQKLFANGEQQQPSLRFNGFTDAWQEKKLGELFKISDETNLDNGLSFSKQDILSVSDKFGIINQIKLQGRSFAGNSISKYKVVRDNQIVYTKSPLKDKPYGIIKIASNVEGIVSPLYVVNDVLDNSAWFMYYYFDLNSRTNNYLKPLVRLGAKHTMNITNEEWLSGKVFISEAIQEQSKIADLLSTVDDLIELNRKKLTAYQNMKQYFLQNMFC